MSALPLPVYQIDCLTLSAPTFCTSLLCAGHRSLTVTQATPGGGPRAKLVSCQHYCAFQSLLRAMVITRVVIIMPA